VARVSDAGLDRSVLHRVAVIGAGTLDILPHSGAIVTLLAVCGSTHREGYATSSWRGSSALPLLSLL
jgi:hypothetical protein